MDEDEIIVNPFEDEGLDETEVTYRTYRMDFENKRIIGMADGMDASAQAMFKALQTRRFAYLIYDDQYGSDIYNKIGNVNLSSAYLDTDIPVMVEDTFLNDDSILGIGDLSYEIIDGDAVNIRFSAFTIFGDADFEGVITDG